MRERRKLRLRAEDSEDLAVVAALLQDARAPLSEMAFDPTGGRFMASFVRYMRECQPDPRIREGLCEIASAVIFEGIQSVRYRGLDPHDLACELRLLTIATAPGRERLLDIDLLFDGGAIIRLVTDRIRCRLEDHGEPRGCTVPPTDHFAEEPSEDLDAPSGPA